MSGRVLGFEAVEACKLAMRLDGAALEAAWDDERSGWVFGVTPGHPNNRWIVANRAFTEILDDGSGVVRPLGASLGVKA